MRQRRKPTKLSRQIGIIEISSTLMRYYPEIAKKGIKGGLPLSIVHDMPANVTEITMLHPQFRVVAEGEKIPMYEVYLEAGKVKYVESAGVGRVFSFNTIR
jgi:hypothetical protein